MKVSHKLRNRILASGVAVALLATTVAGALYFNSDKAYARVTLRGIEDIVSEHTQKSGDEAPNPFIIYEVVPNLADASLGYLVGGEEPIHEGKSIKDMPSERERNRWFGNKFDPYADSHSGDSNFNFDSAKALLNEGAYSYSEENKYTEPVPTPVNPEDPTPDSRTTDVRGTFKSVDADTGYYDPNDYSDAFQAKYYGEAPSDYNYSIKPSTGTIDGKDTYPVNNLWEADNIDVPYRHTEAYREQSDYYTGAYRIQIKKPGSDDIMPIQSRDDEGGHEVNGSTDRTLPIYNWQYFKASLVTASTTLEEGQWIFISENPNGDYLESFGKIEQASNGNLVLRRYNGNDSDFPYTATPYSLSSMGGFRSLARPTPTPTGTPDPNATPTPTGTPDPNATPTPTGTLDPNASPAPTGTPDSNATPTPTDNINPTATPSESPTQVPQGDGGTGDDGTDGNTGNDETGGDQNTGGDGTGTDGNTGNDQTDPNGNPIDNNPGFEIDFVPAPGRIAPREEMLYDGDGYDDDGDGTIGPGEVTDGTQYYYYIVTEISEAEADCLIINSVVEDDESFLGRRVEYTEVLGDSYDSGNCATDKGPYYIRTAETDDYVYAVDGSGNPEGDYNFYADYTKEVYQTVTYAGGIYNNEWFKRFVFDRDSGSQCDNLYIDVKPITAQMLSELSDDELGEADLIYFAGGRYTEDISASVGRKILNKVVEDNFPVAMERSTYYANLDKRSDFTVAFADDDDMNANSERVNLTLLAMSLMQSNKKSISEEDWAALTGTVSYSVDNTIDNFANRPNSDIIPADEDHPEQYGIDNYISTHRSSSLKSMRYSIRDVLDDKDVSFVCGTVFVNDDWVDTTYNDDGTVNEQGHVSTDTNAKIIAPNFNSAYSDGKLESIHGFDEIQNEYDNERPIIETYGEWDDFNSAISKATSIRYILNANNNRYVVKTKLNILDIEPYQSSQYEDQNYLTDSNNIATYDTDSVNKSKDIYNAKYRDIISKDWVLTNLINPTDEEKDEFDITVTQMGTKEFIGHNDDLNATYDMIYIGMDKMLMNTALNSEKFTTVYNNSGMNGLVYAHVGDQVNANFEDNTKDVRFAGNDITSDKLRELTEYVRAGYAVLVSDDFFNLNDDGTIKDINTSRVDSSSHMYEFIKDVVLAKKDDSYLYYGKNVFRKGALEVEQRGYDTNRSDFIKYVNISKLELEVLEKPQAYNDGTDSQGRYLTKEGDGFYHLRYKVKLNNNVALDPAGTSYDCKLYLDMDADGKFEEDEAQDGIEIEGQDTSDGKFHLYAGNTYNISRRTPEDYVGFISWKLAFIQNEKKTQTSDSDETSVRSAITGYSAVPAEGQRPIVKVLQIVPVNQTNTFNLSNAAMDYLYNQVEDFDVQVTTKDVFQYLIKYGTNSDGSASDQSKYSYYDYLCQFDMVVLGFTDMYGFNMDADHLNWDTVYVAGNGWMNRRDIYHDAALAIREYALSGRSILFTHDLSSHRTGMDAWGYYANNFWRDIQGMDRFNVLNFSDNTYKFDRPGVTVGEYKSVYDYAKLKGDEVEKTGMNESDSNRFAQTTGYGNTSLKATNLKAYQSTGTNTSEVETVTAVNNGQITQYPFLITQNVGDTFNVAATHAQYFQLNLDTDSLDDNTNDDVVVWYTISNNIESTDGYTPSHRYYRAIPNDVRNNYYIFSKGNVVYTGSGHSAVSSDQERKLFVNTLIAAYNNGLHAPRVVFKANPWESAPEIKSSILPYDVQMAKDMEDADSDSTTGRWLDEYLTVNFKVMNNNFKDSGKPIYAAYYVQVKNPGEATLTIGNKYYKRVTPASSKGFYQVAGDGTRTLVASDVLTNYKIYQTYFSLGDINFGTGILGDDLNEFYIRIGTEGAMVDGTYDELPATERMSGLSISAAQLFELE